ncbi:MAG TPA: hypothetical protein VE090_01335 [Methylomirabilota bacterium]|nr:hypothetical protein [Methylomirabilota bacterium]
MERLRNITTPERQRPVSPVEHLLLLIDSVRDPQSSVIGGPQLRHALHLMKEPTERVEELLPILTELRENKPKLFKKVQSVIVLASALSQKDGH